MHALVRWRKSKAVWGGTVRALFCYKDNKACTRQALWGPRAINIGGKPYF